MAKRYNITIGNKYIDKTTGEEKTRWNNVGNYVEVVKEDGTVSRFIELYMFPGVKFSVFEEKPRDNNAKNGFNQGYSKPKAKKEEDEELPIIQADDEEVNIEDIPF